MEEVERKFQIGDKVKITGVSFGSVPLNTLDKQGKVVDVDEFGLILVSFDDPEVTHTSWWYDVSQIELVSNVKIKPKSLGELLKEKLGKTGDIVATPTEEVKKPNEHGGTPVVNEKGGVKNFGGKPEPRLLFQSMPEAVMEVIKVLTYGSRKYSPDNWKLVDDFAYHDALQRHYLAKCTGEQNDPDTNLNHLAHMACSVLFLLQKEIDRAKE